MSPPEDQQPLRPVPRDRYVGFEVAGEGAMGLVYLARDTELKRSIAFKIVRPDGAGPASGGTPTTPLEASAPPPDAHFVELRARFLREAWVTGGMEHPGIVPVYELGQTEGGVPYYTMRFVKGKRTLKTAFEELSDAPFEERLRALEPFLKLCDAVSYAHAKGVIHRDIKPANVALGEFGEVVLLDWGLAKDLDQTTPAEGDAPSALQAAADFQTDARGLGTPGYMPPESVRGDVGALDPRSDVYSLGVILFELLTGQLPVALKPFHEYLDRVLNETPPSATSVNAAVPSALDDLCARALCPAQDERLPSARALSDALRAWQTQSALERETEALLREAQGALAAAEESKGPSRIRQTQRALGVLDAAHKRLPQSEHLRRLQAEARALGSRGIKETQRMGRQRVVLVGGITLLALLSIAALVIAGRFNERRKEAEQANLATAAALSEATASREEAHRQAGRAVEAQEKTEREIEAARCAYEILSRMADVAQSKTEAGQRSKVFDVGLEEAVAQDSAAGVFLLLENARDNQPFAKLALGAALRVLPVPPDPGGAEAAARRRTGDAQRAFLAARKGKVLGQTRAKRRALTEAQQAHDRELRAILVALEAGLDAPLPEAPRIEAIQAALSPGDALVSLGRGKDQAVAVVIQKTTRWLRKLGEAAHIAAAVASLREAIEERRDTAAPLQVLQGIVVGQLALPPTNGRVIFIPDGATLLLPFGLLFPDREVCIFPSAAAFLYLHALPPTGGEGILAVADPVDGAGPISPGARAEAEAIGTTRLLGRNATWHNLAATVSSRQRWRAVHLGLPGRITGEGGGGASLTATPGDDADGRLGPLEIARLDARADVGILSSASTRQTPTDMGAGTLELPQALMFAGAQRVVFPTMFGDDESTRALMVKFYELWNPKDGRPGLDAVAALKAAQAYVRGHEKWAHPYYWASWVLWGLP